MLWKPLHISDEPPDDDTAADAIAALIRAIEDNLTCLEFLLATHPAGTGSHRSAAERLGLLLTDLIDGPVLTHTPEERRIQHIFLRTSTAFWGALLASPDPRRAFVRWLRHLDDLTSGRIACPRFTRILVGDGTRNHLGGGRQLEAS